jgi:hypothetical protein
VLARIAQKSLIFERCRLRSNQSRALIQQAQLRYILGQGLDDFQKCFIDSTAVEANIEWPTDSTILVRLIARVCSAGGRRKSYQSDCGKLNVAARLQV